MEDQTENALFGFLGSNYFGSRMCGRLNFARVHVHGPTTTE